MKRKEIKKIFNINRKTLNIIGIALLTIIIIVISIIYSLQMKREYINGDKNLPFKLDKTTIITVLDGQRKNIENDNENENLEVSIVDDIYLEYTINNQGSNQKNKISNIILDKLDIKNEFENIDNIKIIPITENVEETREKQGLKDSKISFKIEEKAEEGSKIRIGFRIYHEKISEKKVRKDEIISYGKGLIENNNDIEKYNLAKINFKSTIIMDNNEEYEMDINIDKVGMERKDFGLFKEENEKKVKILKKYLQN